MSDSPNPILIGVDGGGTGCRAAIGTVSDGILATAQSGPANASSNPDLAIINITAAVNEAAETAGLSPQDLARAHAHLGLAGVITQADSARIESALPFASAKVTEDMPIAVMGALGGGDGYVLSIGTGTIIARHAHGEFNSVNGWGFQLSDQAAGAWLGRASLEHVLLCHDGIETHGDLTRAIFSEFGDDPAAIVTFGLSAKPADYARYAPNIIEAAKAGDLWAQNLMQVGADHLRRGLDALGFTAGDTICLTGGIGPHYADLLPDGYLAGEIARKGSALDGAFNLAKARTLTTQGRQT